MNRFNSYRRRNAKPAIRPRSREGTRSPRDRGARTRRARRPAGSPRTRVDTASARPEPAWNSESRTPGTGPESRAPGTGPESADQSRSPAVGRGCRPRTPRCAGPAPHAASTQAAQAVQTAWAAQTAQVSPSGVPPCPACGERRVVESTGPSSRTGQARDPPYAPHRWGPATRRTHQACSRPWGPQRPGVRARSRRTSESSPLAASRPFWGVGPQRADTRPGRVTGAPSAPASFRGGPRAASPERFGRAIAPPRSRGVREVRSPGTHLRGGPGRAGPSLSAALPARSASGCRHRPVRVIVRPLTPACSPPKVLAPFEVHRLTSR